MNDLITSDLACNLPKTYATMIERINTALPLIEQNSAIFHKSKSQYSNATIDNTALTPMRALYQVLADITRTRRALEEAFLATRKKQVEIKRLQAKPPIDEFDAELNEIEIAELGQQIKATTESIQGALRKLSFLTTQHEHILERIGKRELTEADYEAEEAKAHIMIAFKQALCAARAHGGVIDEGNHIYLFDIGVPGAMAQAEITAYLQMEAELLKQGRAPTHQMTYDWLKQLAEKFAGCGHEFACMRLLTTHDQQSLASDNQ